MVVDAHPARCTRGAARSRRPSRPTSRISSSVSTLGPGESSPALNGSNAGWFRMLARHADRLDPLAPVLLGRQVVEPQRRMHARVGARDLHRAARVRVHRADVHLVAVVARGRRAVVAHRDRQEVEHQVRVRDVVVAAREPAALEVVRGARAAAEEQPLRTRSTGASATSGTARSRPAACTRTGCRPPGGPAGARRRPGRSCTTSMPSALELVGVADARELQQLRRVDRAAAQDDLAGRRRARGRRARCVYSTPTARVALEQDLRDERAGLDLEVRPAHHRVQVRARRGQPAAAMRMLRSNGANPSWR